MITHASAVAAACRNWAIDAVVIGASAGGLDALLTILAGLPQPYRVPVVIVLHLPEDRDSRLAEVFATRLGMPVADALDKAPVVPGTIYFACAGYHLSIERDRRFSLSCEAPVHYSRPCIDILMDSAADAYGPALAGIVLSGASQDGAAGLASVKQAGGLSVVQSPRQAQAPTMPLAAIARAKPDLVLPLEEIHQLLVTLGKR